MLDSSLHDSILNDLSRFKDDSTNVIGSKYRTSDWLRSWSDGKLTIDSVGMGLPPSKPVNWLTDVIHAPPCDPLPGFVDRHDRAFEELPFQVSSNISQTADN